MKRIVVFEKGVISDDDVRRLEELKDIIIIQATDITKVRILPLFDASELQGDDLFTSLVDSTFSSQNASNKFGETLLKKLQVRSTTKTN